MRKLITENQLSAVEKERYQNFLKDNSLDKAYLYFVTDFCPGAGYEIYVSKEKAKSKDRILFFEEPFAAITDEAEMFSNF